MIITYKNFLFFIRSGNILFGVHKKHYILVYCNNKVKETLKVCNIDQFLDIVDKLPPDNTVVIHITSDPIAFSRIVAKKCESLPNNILFTNIQELEGVVEGFFLTKQESVKDGMRTMIKKVDELYKKFEKFETQENVERIIIIFLLTLLLLVYFNFFGFCKILFQLVNEIYH